jgi:hypothetical protein
VRLAETRLQGEQTLITKSAAAPSGLAGTS